MNLCLAGVLDADTLQAVRTALAGAAFSDGTRTAGWHAAPIKHNLQATHDVAARRVHDALMAHELFRAAALPSRLRTPLFSRYVTGMTLQ